MGRNGILFQTVVESDRNLTIISLLPFETKYGIMYSYIRMRDSMGVHL